MKKLYIAMIALALVGCTTQAQEEVKVETLIIKEYVEVEVVIDKKVNPEYAPTGDMSNQEYIEFLEQEWDVLTENEDWLLEILPWEVKQKHLSLKDH